MFKAFLEGYLICNHVVSCDDIFKGVGGVGEVIKSAKKQNVLKFPSVAPHLSIYVYVLVIVREAYT